MRQVIGHGEKITRKRELAIIALLQYPTIGQAAESCGVSVHTLSKWQRDPNFKRDFEAAKARLFDDAIERLRSGTLKASDALIKHIDAECPADSIRAARLTIELYLKTSELRDLARRLEALEQIAAAFPLRGR